VPQALLAKTQENFGDAAMTFKFSKRKHLSKKLETQQMSVTKGSKLTEGASQDKKSLTIENVELPAEEPEVISDFACPIYQTTLRLSTGRVSRTNVPIANVILQTKEKPSKWIKRGVALILEAE